MIVETVEAVTEHDLLSSVRYMVEVRLISVLRTTNDLR